MEKDISGFKRINFRAPSAVFSIVGIVVFGVFFGFLCSFFGFLEFFSGFWVSWLFVSLFFVVPCLFYGFLLCSCFERSLPRRSFLLSLANMVFLFVGIVFLGFFSPLFLFLVGVGFSLNVIGFAGVNGRVDVLPLVFPLIYFGIVLSVLHLSGFFVFSVFRLVVFLGVGVGSLVLVFFVEFLFRTVVPVSAVELFSRFLNKERMSLGFGVRSDVLVQGLFFKSGGGEFVVCVPWLHPGPLRGVGGGSLCGDVIDGLWEDSGGGFFWHVPSSHEEDPCNPGVSGDVLDACFSKNPDYYSKGTRVLESDDPKTKLYGQKFGDAYLIFLNVEEADDYENSIFREIREKTEKRVVFVDMHQLQPSKQGDVISSEEILAKKIKQETLKLLEKLENEQEHEVRIGIELSEDRKTMAMVEEIDDEKYLFLSMDRNGLPDPLREKLEEFETGFDKVLSMTTDTHETISFLDENDASDAPSPELVESAEENLEPVKVGLAESWLENVKVLGKDSYNFSTAVNYSVFSFSALLGVIYLAYFLALV